MSIEKPKFESSEDNESKKNINDDLAHQKMTTDKIEQLYKKPETQEELAENMKVLKEIPEDTTDPKVVIKLGDPEKAHKFVFMEDEDKRQYVIALPIDKKGWHAEIANFSRRLYKKDINVIGGGYIHTENDKLIIDGTSGSYGEAPKEAVREILQKKFPDVEVEAYSLADYDAKRKEEEYRKTLESMESIMQKELYAEVLDRKAIKLGLDYTSRPKNIEGADDFAYMVYSSENGSSFGFDTLYIGFKDKNGEIKSKDILRERWYIRIKKIDADDENINIKYTISNKEKNLIIPIDNLENFETISNLNEIENKLVDMYKGNQKVYEKANVYHGIG